MDRERNKLINLDGVTSGGLGISVEILNHQEQVDFTDNVIVPFCPKSRNCVAQYLGIVSSSCKFNSFSLSWVCLWHYHHPYRSKLSVLVNCLTLVEIINFLPRKLIVDTDDCMFYNCNIFLFLLACVASSYPQHKERHTNGNNIGSPDNIHTQQSTNCTLHLKSFHFWISLFLQIPSLNKGSWLLSLCALMKIVQVT